MSDFDFPLPPPTFEFLAFSLKSQAEMHLGIIVFEEETPPKPNLAAARHVIDLLAMLGEKTRGNLEMEEQRLIENSLTELRFRYVQITEKQAKETAASGENAAAVESAEGGGKDQAPE